MFIHAASLVFSGILVSLLGLAPEGENPNRLSNEERQAGFELLFNGADLAGWEQ